MYNLLSRPSKGTKNALFLGDDGLTGWQRETLKTGVPEWIFMGGGCHIYAVELARQLGIGRLAVLTGKSAAHFSNREPVGFHTFLLERECILDVAGVKPLRPYVEQVVAKKVWNFDDFEINLTSVEDLLLHSPSRVGEVKNKWGHWVNEEFVIHASKIARQHIEEEWKGTDLDFPSPIELMLDGDDVPRIYFHRKGEKNAG